MDFSKHKLHKYLTEGQALENGAQSSLTASTNSSMDARDGKGRARDRQIFNKGQQNTQKTQIGTVSPMSNTRYENSEYNKQLIKEKEVIRAIETQKSDWRAELQEKVVDGQERQQHPFVTVMPTGDENLIQAVEQMAKTAKKKKDDVTEAVELEEAKKKCKEGYKYDSDKKKCVKKKKKKSSSKKRTTIVVGRPLYGGGIHHHHHNDDGDDIDGDGGESAGGGGEGGGMAEMFDLLGDMLLKEKLESGKEYHERMKKKAKEPINPHQVVKAEGKNKAQPKVNNQKAKVKVTGDMTAAIKSTRNYK